MKILLIKNLIPKNHNSYSNPYRNGNINHS